MILQCAEALSEDPRWKMDGCNICTCFWFANKLAKVEITPRFMISSANDFVRRGAIESNFRILDYEAVYAYLGLPVRYFDEWTNRDYICKENEFEHLYWERFWNGEFRGHFTGGNGSGFPTYDSYGESNSVQYGTLKNKRVFERLS